MYDLQEPLFRYNDVSFRCRLHPRSTKPAGLVDNPVLSGNSALICPFSNGPPRRVNSYASAFPKAVLINRDRGLLVSVTFFGDFRGDSCVILLRVGSIPIACTSSFCSLSNPIVLDQLRGPFESTETYTYTLESPPQTLVVQFVLCLYTE